MSNASAVVTAATMLWLAGSPCPATAQTPFLDAIRELATTASSPTGPADVMQRRTATLVRMRAALGEWDRAIAALESRITLELRGAADARAFQLRVELGLAYRQRGRLGDAVREFDAAAVLQRNASDVHVLRALTLDAARARDEASRAFRTAWLRDAANPVKAYLALTPRSALDAAERERARTVLHGVFAREPARDPRASGPAFLVLDPVPDNLLRAPVVADAAMAGVFARLAEGQLDDGLRLFNANGAAAASDSEVSPLGHFERGRAEELEGHYAEARQAYQAALAGTLTGRHVLYVGIGRLAQVEGELGAATEAFVHAVRLNPNDPLIHRELAGAYAGAGRIEDALSELAAALLLDPRDVAALAAAGNLLLESDRATDAVAVLTRAVAANANSVEAHYALAVALSRAGRTEEATRQFERFARMSQQALEHRRREATGQAAPGDAGR